MAIVLAALLLKLFVLDVYPVREQSMWPTLDGDEGDRILVEKVSRLFGRPDRFRICVFRHKDGSFLVKRLLGLPGETVDFRAGDLFVKSGDDFVRVPRPEGLVEAQMIPVPPGGPAALELEVEAAAGGRVDRDGAAFVLTPGPGKNVRAFVVGGAGIDRYDIRNDRLAPARPGESRPVVRGRESVPDVRVTLGPIALGDGWLAIKHAIGRGDAREVVVRREGLELVTTTDGAESGRDRFPGVPCNRGLRLETIDGWFRILVPDGEGWRLVSAQPRKTESLEGQSTVRFEAAGGTVRLGSLEVARDVHYAWGAEQPDGPSHRVIPDDCMFLVGDNPEVSKDSRDRDAIGSVPLSSLVGVVRAIVFPFRRMGIPR